MPNGRPAEFPDGVTEVDVLVIGSGQAGLSTTCRGRRCRCRIRGAGVRGGARLLRAVRAAVEAVGRAMFRAITADRVRWSDGAEQRADVLLWGTGFRAALDHLAPLHPREPGGGIRLDGTRVVREPRVHLVGYGPSASTVGANRAGRTAVRELVALLDEQGGR